MNPITVDSLYDLKYVDDVRISPDGRQVAFVRLTLDRSANENVRSIWIKDLADTTLPAQPFTTGRKDSQPRWTKDGTRLGFLSERNGKPAVYCLRMTGGEGHKIATHQNGISGFEWSPDGTQVAFTAGLRTDEARTQDEVHQGHEPQAANPPLDSGKDAWEKKREEDQRDHEESLHYDPRIVHEFPYRAGTTFMNDRWSHVYVSGVPADFAEGNPVKPFRLTEGEGDYELPVWTQDGRTLVSSVSRHPEHTRIERWSDTVTIQVAGKIDERATHTLLSTRFGYIHPLASPDGQWLAFFRHNQELPEFTNTTLAILPSSGGDPIVLTESLDRSVLEFAWSKDSAHLYFTLLKDGAVNLFRVGVNDRVIEQLTDEAHEITCFDVGEDGRIVFVASTAGDPSALYLREPDGRITLLYQPNAAFLADHTVSPTEAVLYQSEQWDIQGWMITPPGFDPSQKYPLALEIHGGPSAMWGPATRSMWHEWQVLANRGYVVFFCNPRGSGGYGEQFQSANRGDWGDGPMRDILRGVDLVVERGFIDTERMVMTGGSYGGYLTAWIVGRDHRFKAAVAQRGVYNLISMRGVTDIPAFNDRESGTTPWEDVKRLWDMSPVSLAPNVRTPLLLEHSELDYRVPISQAEELYLALRTHKATVELVRWPREGHELSRSGEPRHRAERVRRILDWFDQYTKKA